MLKLIGHLSSFLLSFLIFLHSLIWLLRNRNFLIVGRHQKCSLYKGSGKKSNFSNYRPIWQLPSLRKLFEKYIFLTLSDFLDINSYLFPNQFGFRRKRPTIGALLQIQKTICNARHTDVDHWMFVLLLLISKKRLTYYVEEFYFENSLYSD
jgi:hypothetical protein